MGLSSSAISIPLIDSGVRRSAAFARLRRQDAPSGNDRIVAGVGLVAALRLPGASARRSKSRSPWSWSAAALAPLLILLVLPVLIDFLSRRKAPVGARQPAPAE
jgi:hypothetical protein